MSAPLPPASELSALLADRVDSVVPSLLSKATRSGNYWHIGSVAGEAGKSLYVLRSGARAGWWQDSATGEHGDLLDLAGAVNGTDLRGACDWARSFLGLGGGDRDRVHHHGGVQRQDNVQRQLDDDDQRVRRMEPTSTGPIPRRPSRPGACSANFSGQAGTCWQAFHARAADKAGKAAVLVGAVS